MSSYVAPEVHRLVNFSTEAAAFIAERILAGVAARSLFRLALSGGNTPRRIHEILTTNASIPWEKVQFTFGDERCVPADHPDSNFRMAEESLFQRISLPPGNVFRLRGEIDPKEAAREYEEKLATVAARFGEVRYRHDLILLGLGEDGHTASLFPGQPSLEETSHSVIPALGPKPPPQRLTFTFPLLNAAREIAFLVMPKGKEQVLDEAIAGDQRHPAARVRPEDGKVNWLVAAG